MPVLLHPVIGGLPKACRQARDPNLVHTVTWTPSMCNTDLPIVIPLELSGWVLAGSPALTGLIRSFTITVLLSSQRKIRGTPSPRRVMPFSSFFSANAWPRSESPYLYCSLTLALFRLLTLRWLFGHRSAHGTGFCT